MKSIAMCPTPMNCVTLILLTTSDVTRPIRLISGHNIKKKRPIVCTAIHWARHIEKQEKEEENALVQELFSKKNDYIHSIAFPTSMKKERKKKVKENNQSLKCGPNARQDRQSLGLHKHWISVPKWMDRTRY